MKINLRLLLFMLILAVVTLPFGRVWADIKETTSKSHLLMGELLSVDVKQSTLTIKCLINDKEPSYREETFRIDPSTKIRRFGEPVTLAQLQIGTQVAFIYSEALGTRKILRTLQVKD